jgi:hypothetical protein
MLSVQYLGYALEDPRFVSELRKQIWLFSKTRYQKKFGIKTMKKRTADP